MKDQILSNIGEPANLEKLYRSNPANFKDSFFQLREELTDSPMAAFWQARLQTDSESISWGTSSERWFLLVGAIILGVGMKLPSWFSIQEDTYFGRNGAFLAMGALIAFFAWKNQLKQGTAIWISGIMSLAVLYINAWSWDTETDTLLLASLHLPLLIWGLLGWSFTGDEPWNLNKRLDYVRLNGDMVILCTVLLLAGGLTTGITIGLFELIGLSIGDFFFQNIVLVTLPSIPLLAILILLHNPSLVNKVSPVVAKIFSPLVLGILVIYLISMVFSTKSIYTDREFLLLFNILLIGVMALIVFSIGESSKNSSGKLQLFTLVALASVTLIINGLALHAISLRILEFGWTPNRIAVLGSNLLMLTHLLLVTRNLWIAFWDTTKAPNVGWVLVKYLPYYLIWIAFVVFGLPLFFGF